jgi:hypothetical protein
MGLREDFLGQVRPLEGGGGGASGGHEGGPAR